MSDDSPKHVVDTAITAPEPKHDLIENAFSGVTSFYRRRYTKDLSGVDLAVTGIPFDQAVSNRPGTRLGPRAIREASTLQAYDPPYGWDVNPMTDIAMVDYGDLGFDVGRPEKFVDTLEAHATGILDQGAACLALGGDHFITYPLLKAHAKKHGPLALVQFDAHTDTWSDDEVGRVDHGTMFYKAVKEGLIDVEKSVQVGIRTTIEDPLGITILDARQVHLEGPVDIAVRIKRIVGDHPVYLTFDIDALDPAFAPGTGTPVWGGLSSAQAACILRDLAGINIVGGDVVEVSPPFDTTGATAIAGAHVAVELACLWTYNHLRRGAT